MLNDMEQFNAYERGHIYRNVCHQYECANELHIVVTRGFYKPDITYPNKCRRRWYAHLWHLKEAQKDLWEQDINAHHDVSYDKDIRHHTHELIGSELYQLVEKHNRFYCDATKRRYETLARQIEEMDESMYRIGIWIDNLKTYSNATHARAIEA